MSVNNNNNDPVMKRVELLEHGMTKNAISKKIGYSGKAGERDLQVVARGGCKKYSVAEAIEILDNMLRDRGIPIPADAAVHAADVPQRQSERERPNGQQGNVDDRVDVVDVDNDVQPYQHEPQQHLQQQEQHQQVFAASARRDDVLHRGMHSDATKTSAHARPAPHVVPAHERQQLRTPAASVRHGSQFSRSQQVTPRGTAARAQVTPRSMVAGTRGPAPRVGVGAESPRTRLHKLEVERDAAVAEAKSLREQLRDEQLQCDRLFVEAAAERADKEQAEAAAGQLQSQLNQMQADYDSLERVCDTQHQEIDTLRGRNDTLAEQLAVSRMQAGSAAATWDTLQRGRDELRNMVHALRSENAGLQRERDALRRECVAVESEKAQLEAKLSAAEEEIAASTFDPLHEQLAECINELAAQHARETRVLRADRNKLTAECGELRVKCAEHEERAAAAELATAERHALVGILMVEVASLHDQVRQLLAHPVEIEQGAAAAIAAQRAELAQVIEERDALAVHLAAQRAECATLSEQRSALLVEREQIELNGAAAIAEVQAKCDDLEAMLVALTSTQCAEHESHAPAVTHEALASHGAAPPEVSERAALAADPAFVAHMPRVSPCVTRHAVEAFSTFLEPVGRPRNRGALVPLDEEGDVATVTTPRHAALGALEAADLIPDVEPVELDEAAAAHEVDQLPAPVHVSYAPPTIAEVTAGVPMVAGDSPTRDDDPAAAADQHEPVAARDGVPLHPLVARRMGVVRTPATPTDLADVADVDALGTPPRRRLWSAVPSASPPGATRELSPEMASLLPASLESPFVAAAETPSDVAWTPIRREEPVAARDDEDADAGDLRTVVREDDTAAVRARLFWSHDHPVLPQPTPALRRPALGQTYP